MKKKKKSKSTIKFEGFTFKIDKGYVLTIMLFMEHEIRFTKMFRFFRYFVNFNINIFYFKL